MNQLRRISQALRLGLIAAGVWVASAPPAWAQEVAGEAVEEKSYVLSYALVALCVILALMLVLRPVGRTDEVKKDAS